MKLIHTLTVVALSASLGACIVAPHRPYAYVNEGAAPASVTVNAAYVTPNYPQPAVGYYWAFNPFIGWGWRHNHHGWHNGHRGHRGHR